MQSKMYSVVILKENGDVISRPAGTDFQEAKVKAQSRREDFPEALEIRLIELVSDSISDTYESNILSTY